jgi:hypothetical protein
MLSLRGNSSPPCVASSPCRVCIVAHWQFLLGGGAGAPAQGARFESHYEKLRNRVEDDGAVPFEARVESLVTDGQESIRWSSCSLKPPLLMQAAELFAEGMTVREVASALRISKSEAGRLGQRAIAERLLVAELQWEDSLVRVQ